MFHGQMRLFCGNANPPLSEAIAGQLGMDLGDMEVGRFADSEVAVELNESTRGMDVFVIQPTCRPVNENLMELLVMLDAGAYTLSRANRFTTLMPPAFLLDADQKLQYLRNRETPEDVVQESKTW